MRRHEIKVGVTYSDGKGNVREVQAEGSSLALSRHCYIDDDWILYLMVRRSSGPVTEGSIVSCTRRAFARWAREIVKERA